MTLLKQSTTYTRAFLMVLSVDHLTGATGKSVTVNLSKAGGAFANAGGTVLEIANGWYKVSLTTADSNTLGDLAFNCTAAGCDSTDFADQVIAVDVADSVRFGLTSLPNVTVALSGGLVTSWGGSGAVSVGQNLDKSGYTTSVLSGTAYLASGSVFLTTFASGVLGTSGGLPTAWGSSGSVSVGQVLGSVLTSGSYASGLLTVDIPDNILRRDFSLVSGEARRSLLNATRKLANNWTVAGGTLTVYKEDGVTVAFTQTVASQVGAAPVTGLTN